jgi:uncharacterized membrane-anchored protein
MKSQKINKKWWFFAAAILAQFIVMFLWVLRSNDTLENGAVYKFRLQGYDPHDPFRGEYLRILLKDNIIEMQNKGEATAIINASKVYASFSVDDEGFAMPMSLSQNPSDDALKVEVSRDYYVSTEMTSIRIRIQYPFDRLWMNQKECPIAEKIVNDALFRNKHVYALVSIKNGDGALKDVEVDGVSIKDLVKKEREQVDTDAGDIEEVEVIAVDSAEMAKIDSIIAGETKD